MKKSKKITDVLTIYKLLNIAEISNNNRTD